MAGRKVLVKKANILLIDSDELLSFDDIQGNAVYQALASRKNAGFSLLIRTDADLPARNFVAIIMRLTALGITRVELAAEYR